MGTIWTHPNAKTGFVGNPMQLVERGIAKCLLEGLLNPTLSVVVSVCVCGKSYGKVEVSTLFAPE
jgi:hypothetical protein